MSYHVTVLFFNFRFVVFSLCLVSLFFCSNDPEREPSPPSIIEKGTVVASLIRSTIDGNASIQTLVENLGIVSADIRYDVDLFKIIYDTTYDNQKLRASAMVVIPKKDGDLSLVAVQHGTILAQREAPSEWNVLSPASMNFLEGLFDAMIAGYVSINVDYLGFGESHDNFSVHPYLIRDSYPQDIISAIRFTKKELAQKKNIKLKNQLFLRGYSEGAFATLATQSFIEFDPTLKNEFNIQAVAVGAGPYDLLYTASQALSDPSGMLVAPSFAPYVYLAAEQAYDWKKSHMEAIFKTDTNVIRQLFNRENKRREIEMDMAVPKSLSALFKADALNALKVSTISDTENSIFREFKEKLIENSLHSDWVPSAPTRLYHCAGDKIVASGNTTSQAVGLVKGRDITSGHASANEADSGYILDTTMGNSHSACPLYGLPIKEWFDKF